MDEVTFLQELSRYKKKESSVIVDDSGDNHHLNNINIVSNNVKKNDVGNSVYKGSFDDGLRLLLEEYYGSKGKQVNDVLSAFNRYYEQFLSGLSLDDMEMLANNQLNTKQS